MSWETFMNSDAAQKFGVSIIFIAVSYLVWDQMNAHITGRLESQDARIAHMQKENEFMREFIKDEQDNRKTLFQAIEGHLKELTRARQ